MLESIVASCRAMACDARLMLLHQLAQAPELACSELAEQTAMARNRTSVHLGHLASLGFLARRRSGARVFYRLADDDRQRRRAAPVLLLRRSLEDMAWATAGWEEESPIHLARSTWKRVGRPAARTLDVIFDAATAFANMRRLQILGLLAERDACGRVGSAAGPRMSREAWWRHMEKLRRRGYVVEVEAGLWRLARTHLTRFHAGLRSYVFSELGIGARSS